MKVAEGCGKASMKVSRKWKQCGGDAYMATSLSTCATFQQRVDSTVRNSSDAPKRETTPSDSQAECSSAVLLLLGVHNGDSTSVA